MFESKPWTRQPNTTPSLVSDETCLVLRDEGLNITQKISRDLMSTFGKLKGPKTFFSLVLITYVQATKKDVLFMYKYVGFM